MKSCWLENPNNRPDFTEIKQILHKFIIEMKAGEEHVSLIDQKPQ